MQKELQDSAGLAFIRRYLSLYDFAQLEWITLRRSPRSYYSIMNPMFGTCWLPRGTPTGLFRINCNILASVRYPARVRDAEKPSSGERQPYYLNDENEAVVAIIALEVGHYLGRTGHIVGVGANEFMKSAAEAYRRSIGDAPFSDELPGPLASPARVGWCVECGMMLSTVGGSHTFCSDRCRWTYHNRLRGARLAARRPEKVCEACGAKFMPPRSDAMTCSPACRQKKYRKLRKDRTDLHERV